MSVECMTRVWKSSKHKGSQLLLLLAIADHAGDEGFAWPGIPSLAKKTRMSERHTMRMLDELEHSGELLISKSGGKNHQYIVTIGLTTEEINKTAITKMFKISTPDKSSPLTSRHPRQVVTPDKLSPTPDKLSKAPLTSCHLTPDKLSKDTSCNEKEINDLRSKNQAESSCKHHEEETSMETSIRVVSRSLDRKQNLDQPQVSFSLPEEKTLVTQIELKTEKQPTNQQKLLEAFVILLRLNMKFYKGGYSRLAKEIQLFYSAEITAEQIEKFTKWWYLEDFRGKKDQPPTIDQIGKLLPTALAWTDPETIEIEQPSTSLTISRPQPAEKLIPTRGMQTQKMIDEVFEARRRKSQ